METQDKQAIKFLIEAVEVANKRGAFDLSEAVQVGLSANHLRKILTEDVKKSTEQDSTQG